MARILKTQQTLERPMSSAVASSRGAEWLRVDLHLHSPGVESFACPAGVDIKSASGIGALARQYVDRLNAAAISVAALTDYNGVREDWFDAISKEAPRSMTILPGAEVSFRAGKYGLHVLAIFDRDTKPESINSFLQSLDRDSATPLFLPDRTHRDIDPKQNLLDSLMSLRERFRCLLILPHPDQENGFCKSLKLADGAQLIEELRPDAVEHCPEAQIRRLESTGMIQDGLLERTAFVEFSDSKSMDEIGNKRRSDGALRATYLKLSATDIDALRLALHDPTTRLALVQPPDATHTRIREVEISGSGFLGTCVFKWSDDLSVLIGGRGAGKSAVIETMRYALGIEPHSEQTYRGDLIKYALGSGGKVSVKVERPVGSGRSRVYRVERIWGEEARVSEEESDSLVGIRPADVFGPAGRPAIFGQREIYAISASEAYRVQLLDELIGEEARRAVAAVGDCLQALRLNADALLAARSRLAKREEHRQRLQTVNHEISVYEKNRVAEQLRSATLLKADGQYLRTASDAVRRLDADLKKSEEEVASPIESAIRNLGRARSAQRAILEQAASVLGSLGSRLRELFEASRAAVAGAAEDMEKLSARWQLALKPLEDELNRLKRESNLETLDPDRLLRLTEEKALLTPQIEELDRVEAEIKELMDSRTKLIDDLRTKRHEEHQLRRDRALAIQKSMGDRIHLLVEFKGQKEQYRRELTTILKGSGVSTDAVERLAAPDATDGLALAQAIRNGPGEIQDKFSLTSAMSDRLCKWFEESEQRILDLETRIPSDSLDVGLPVDGVVRSIDRLSPGQRATAILLLLFALQGRILILDQPEDDLDNRFVYEDVVQILRRQKGILNASERRQVIAATHNPNIPVLGDAELVVVLEAKDGRASASASASIDDGGIRERIKSIMEGGEEAFRRRAEKYGGR